MLSGTPVKCASSECTEALFLRRRCGHSSFVKDSKLSLIGVEVFIKVMNGLVMILEEDKRFLCV